jgi:hypothetical protein
MDSATLYLILIMLGGRPNHAGGCDGVRRRSRYGEKRRRRKLPSEAPGAGAQS